MSSDTLYLELNRYMNIIITKHIEKNGLQGPWLSIHDNKHMMFKQTPETMYVEDLSKEPLMLVAMLTQMHV